MKVVIVGGGPNGLYLAWKLAQKDTKSVLIDAHLGEYYRPGHLNSTVFRTIRDDVPEQFLAQLDRGRHIKDLERVLFAMAQSKPHKIQLEKATFLRLDTTATSEHAVVIRGADGQEQMIEADVVFDCTGGKRAVLQSAQQRLPEFEWTLASKYQPVHPSHLLYYCTIDRDSTRMLDLFNMNDGAHLGLDGEALLTMTRKLRQFGWNAPSFPTLYTYNFGNSGKHALYCAAPSTLKQGDYHHWVSMITQYKTGLPSSTIDFLPSGNPAKQKLRQMHFPMHYDRLMTIGRQGDDKLPSIIAVGDAQIGFDYRRAHGAEDGLERVQQLMMYVEGYKGSLEFLDTEGYLNAVRTSLNRHESALKTMVYRDIARCITANKALLRVTKPAFSLGLFDAGNNRLIENAQHSLVCLEALEKVESIAKDLRTLSHISDTIGADVPQLIEQLSHALKNLPERRSLEHRLGNQALTELTHRLKDTANRLFKARNYADTVPLYHWAMTIAHFQGDLAMEYVLISNSILAHSRQNNGNDIAILADKARTLPSNEDVEKTRAKIIYNVALFAVKNPSHDTLVPIVLDLHNDPSVKQLSAKQKETILNYEKTLAIPLIELTG